MKTWFLVNVTGLTVEEYLTATAQGPGLYTSTSRDAISLQYGNSISQQQHLPPPPPPAPAPSPNPCTPPLYRIPVPDLGPTNSLPRSYSRSSSHSSRPRLQNRSSSLKERAYPPKYEDICFDVWLTHQKHTINDHLARKSNLLLLSYQTLSFYIPLCN